MCRDRLAPAPVLLSVSAKSSSHPLLSSSCVWITTSMTSLPSGNTLHVSLKFLFDHGKSYLTTVMAFVTPWSISLALADTYSVLLKQLPHEPRLLSMVLAGDTVMSFLSLGGACGVASATQLLSSLGAPICGDNLCSQYQVSATLAFLCWFLLLASALFNLWSLPSLLY
ncbi:hypothetical protein Bca4012_094879 [Brassica carinata]